MTDPPTSLDLTDYDAECTSVTGELIPHHRPIAREVLGTMTSTASRQKLLVAQSRLATEDLQHR